MATQSKDTNQLRDFFTDVRSAEKVASPSGRREGELKEKEKRKMGDEWRIRGKAREEDKKGNFGRG